MAVTALLGCRRRPAASCLRAAVLCTACFTLLLVNTLSRQPPTPQAHGQSEQEHVCPPPGRLLSADTCARLGNVMFEYAALLAANQTLRRPAWLQPKMADTLGKYFDSLSIPTLPSHCVYNWTKISAEGLIHDAPKNRSLNHLIVNYPTSVPLFHPLRQRVLREFTFRQELRDLADQRLAELARRANRTDPTFIAVHVRRTDYAQWLPRFVKGRLVDSDYLERALALMRGRHSGALFVVASDDPEWCQRRLRAPDVVLAGDGVQARPGADLALLAACNHTVLTHGTFGFWAAYLAGGQVVKPTGYGKQQTGVEGNVRRAALDWTWIPAFSPQTTTPPAPVIHSSTDGPPNVTESARLSSTDSLSNATESARLSSTDGPPNVTESGRLSSTDGPPNVTESARLSSTDSLLNATESTRLSAISRAPAVR